MGAVAPCTTAADRGYHLRGHPVVSATDTSLLTSSWNPHTPTLPLAALLVTSAGTIAGRHREQMASHGGAADRRDHQPPPGVLHEGEWRNVLPHRMTAPIPANLPATRKQVAFLHAFDQAHTQRLEPLSKDTILFATSYERAVAEDLASRISRKRRKPVGVEYTGLSRLL